MTSYHGKVKSPTLPRAENSHTNDGRLSVFTNETKGLEFDDKMMKRLLVLVMSCMSGPEFLYPDDPRLHSDEYVFRNHHHHHEVSG